MSAPTVQELLHVCARHVRSIMWDITDLDGPALAAGWPAFAADAGAALAAVPCPDPATQLLASRTQGPRSRPHRWGPPVGAAPDPHLVAAGRALAAVTELLVRHAAPPKSAEAASDADLARRRIAECLLIGSHATALGLREHATRLRPARPGIAFEQPGVRLAVAGATLAQSRRLASELDTLSAHAAHYLARSPAGSQGHQGVAFVDPDLLPRALAGWEVCASRALHASPPSVGDLVAVARSEQALLVHTVVILKAAVPAGLIDQDCFTAQIHPRLEDAHLAWGAVAASWPAAMSTRTPPAPAGAQASTRLHQALAQVTRDGNGWAAPALIARRVHPAQVSELLRGAVIASVNRAERFAELPGELARAGQLRAPARLLAGLGQVTCRGGDEPVGAVRITDIANRRIITVRPEQTAGATATARDLGRTLRTLTQALETLSLAGPGRAAVPASTPGAGPGLCPVRPVRPEPLATRIAPHGGLYR
jgi:hypothetical protein